jgi:hypothetical protein
MELDELDGSAVRFKIVQGVLRQRRRRLQRKINLLVLPRTNCPR